MPINSPGILSVSIPVESSFENLEKFRQEVEEHLRHLPGTIEIDTSILVNVSSSHVGALWQAYLRCYANHVAFKLKDPSPYLIRVLKIMDLDTILAKDQSPVELYIKEAVLSFTDGHTDPYTDEFQANAESVDKACEDYTGFLKQYQDIPDMVRHDLRTIFYEIATNIRTHAGIEDGEKIVFSFTMKKNKAILCFADSGKPFNPTRYVNSEDVQLAIKRGRTRGFGIPMLSKMTDNMKYNRLHDILNVLAVEKSWG
jgi:anti-sigma regulatory factor (Ser/Thr protein kinase)/anti-anti-sigma regulatory factor